MMKKDITDRSYFSKYDYTVRFNEILDRIKPLKYAIALVINVLLTVTRKFVKKNSDNSNLAVISLMRLGDTVFSVPALKVLVSQFPDRRIHVLCYSESKTIYNLVFKDINFVTVEKSDFYLGRRIAARKIRRIINALKPGIIYDLTGTVTSASMIFNSGASEIYGAADPYFKAIYSRSCGKRNKPHLIDKYLDAIETGGEFSRSPELYEYPVQINRRSYLLIHPLSVRKAKEWNLVKFIALAERLSFEYDTCFIVPEGSLDDDILEEIRRKNIRLIVTKSFQELIDLIQGSSVYISNDTGPVYIANLLGKSTFSIFGPGNPFYPLSFGKYHRFVRKVLPCSPDKKQQCFKIGGITCNHYDCMNSLGTEDVYGELKQLLNDLGIETLNQNCINEA